MDKGKLWLLTIAALIVSVIAISQEQKLAMISGIVKDSRTKQPLIEAVVTLSSDKLNGQKFALTDSTGMYSVKNLQPGIYTVSFEMEGYEKFTQDSIVLQEGMSLGVSFQMARERRKQKTGSR